MNPDIFGEWLKRQGYHVHKTESSYWFNQGPKALQAFPYHWIIQPEEIELENLLKQTKSITLRYSTPLSAPEGHISYQAILFDKAYSIEKLGKWARKNIRRGLSNCKVEEISFEKLAKEGYELQLDTLYRQGRGVHIVRSEWETRCLSAKDLPGFKAWGAIVNDKLAASVITFSMNNCAYMLYQQCLRDYLEAHVNNALGYVVTMNMMALPEIDSILYGLHSLDAPSTVDEFKFRMGYEALPVRQRVEFNPIFKPFVNSASYQLLKTIRKVSASNPVFAKAEGMIRFYRNGKKPLVDQSWPGILREQHDRMIEKVVEF